MAHTRSAMASKPTPAAAAARLAPVEARSRREGVVREIRRAIVLGDLVSGQKLTETSLSGALNVSRPTIREALAQLVNEGFLTAEPYREIRVASLSPAEMEDTARVRMALDRLAIDLIVEDATGRRLERVRAAWADYERDIAADDPLLRHTAHILFHRSLWDAADNVMLERYWPVTEAHITLQLAMDQRLASNAGRDVHVHRQIVEAIERAATGDDSAVEPALTRHTLGSVHDLIAALKTTPVE